MKLLIDANITYRSILQLRELGYEIFSVLEEIPKADDIDILRKAFKNRWVLITHDKDFGELVFKNGMAHSGIILIRSDNESASSMAQMIHNFFSSHLLREIQEHFWVLSESTYRKRK
ncbi:MAG: DUF5615 family PIN-like protein [Candidatus Magasanikbacteria bacterium]|nr:DUF5615 family PIN-like protein [Candidatus Magasanikbacteria bacterium]